MAERKWLRLDKSILDRPELSEMLEEPGGYHNVLLYCKLLLDIGELVPCDKQALAKKVKTDPSTIQTVLNRFYKLGLVKFADRSPTDPPSLEEIEAYCKELNSAVDPQRFYDCYAADGFTFKGQPMDWKAKLRQWNVKERQTCSRAFRISNNVTEEDYIFPDKL